MADLDAQYLSMLVREISGQSNTLTIPRFYVDLCGGDIQVALFLTQCIEGYNDNADGWFAKTAAEWKQEICIGRSTLDRATKTLEEKGVLETAIRKINEAPTKHYRIIPDALCKMVIDHLDECGA